MFKTKDASDTLLNSIQLSYANQVKPSTRWTSEYNGTTNKLSQRYLDTQFESGKFWHFVAGGLVFVAVFLLLVFAAVKGIIASAS